MELIYAQLSAEGVAIALSRLAQAVDAPHLVRLDAYDETILGKRYEPVTHRWLARPPAAPAPQARRVSVLAFRRRFTAAERVAIEWAAVDRADQPVAQRQQAAALRATLADQAAAKFIDLDDSDTVTGVQGLEAIGLIGPGRAAQILNNAIQTEELP